MTNREFLAALPKAERAEYLDCKIRRAKREQYPSRCNFCIYFGLGDNGRFGCRKRASSAVTSADCFDGLTAWTDAAHQE